MAEQNLENHYQDLKAKLVSSGMINWVHTTVIASSAVAIALAGAELWLAFSVIGLIIVSWLFTGIAWVLCKFGIHNWKPLPAMQIPCDLEIVDEYWRYTFACRTCVKVKQINCLPWYYPERRLFSREPGLENRIPEDMEDLKEFRDIIENKRKQEES